MACRVQTVPIRQFALREVREGGRVDETRGHAIC